MIYPNTIGTIGEKIAYEQGYDAGRADFITSELPKLLDMAREMESKGRWYKYTIPDLIDMSEKGEE